MSPVIRKWGMRGVAALCVGAFGVSGTVLYVGVFAAVNGELATVPIAQTELPGEAGWWLAFDRYGLPLVILAIISYYVRKGVIAAWEYFKPLGQQVAGVLVHSLQKQGEFAENANTLLTKSVASDETNGIMIRETHGLVKEIHGEILK